MENYENNSYLNKDFFSYVCTHHKISPDDLSSHWEKFMTSQPEKETYPEEDSDNEEDMDEEDGEMDEYLQEHELSSLLKTDLVNLCRKLNLKVSGTKIDLINRLIGTHKKYCDVKFPIEIETYANLHKIEFSKTDGSNTYVLGDYEDEDEDDMDDIEISDEEVEQLHNDRIQPLSELVGNYAQEDPNLASMMTQLDV